MYTLILLVQFGLPANDSAKGEKKERKEGEGGGRKIGEREKVVIIHYVPTFLDVSPAASTHGSLGAT